MTKESEPQFKDVPEIETEELKVALINQDEELESRARFEGENNLARRTDQARGIGRLVMRFWQNGIAKNYYRQRAINDSRRRIRESQKLYSEASDSEYREYKRNVCKTFLMNTEDAIDPDRGNRRKSLKVTNPELHAAVKDLIERYADGRITDREALKREFSHVIDGLADGEYSSGSHLSVNNIAEVAIKARYNFENLATAAESVNSEFNHAESMSKVMKGFDVLYGKRNTDTIDPHYSRVDKVVDKLSQTRVGSLVSHETLALAAGAAACVTTVASKRALRTACLIPGLGSAIYATAEAGVQFEDNRARAQRDERYNREYDGNQKERQRMKETLYTFQKSEDLKSLLDTQIDAIRNKLILYLIKWLELNGAYVKKVVRIQLFHILLKLKLQKSSLNCLMLWLKRRSFLGSKVLMTLRTDSIRVQTSCVVLTIVLMPISKMLLGGPSALRL